MVYTNGFVIPKTEINIVMKKLSSTGDIVTCNIHNAILTDFILNREYIYDEYRVGTLSGHEDIVRTQSPREITGTIRFKVPVYSPSGDDNINIAFDNDNKNTEHNKNSIDEFKELAEMIDNE